MPAWYRRSRADFGHEGKGRRLRGLLRLAVQYILTL